MKVCIIGGGLGGLFTGAILAREGVEVTVLEKNAIIGGGLQTFVRGDAVFDTAMHILVGLVPHGNIRRICQYLGIFDSLDIRPTDTDCTDSIYYHSDGAVYRLPRGPEAFTEYLAALFPTERTGIQGYVEHIHHMVQAIDLYCLRETGDSIPTIPADFIEAADAMIARFVADTRLRDILAYVNPMYAGVPGHTPAYIHALLAVLEMHGTYRFAGGSVQLAHALRDVITGAGGRVLPATPATRVAVADRQVQYVEDSRGRRHTADTYISAIHPCALLDITDEGAFPKAYVRRLRDIPETYSAFSVFITLRPGTFPYLNHTCYYQDDYGMVWNYAETGADWPRGMMYLTPPVPGQGEYARTLVITTPMPYSEVERWAHTSVGHRDPGYQAWKQEKAAALIGKLRRVHPGIDSCIERVETASPLTIRDYYGSRRGSLYGYRKDCQDIVLAQVPVATKVRNLLLTGQNINLHGLCGVPLSAITTAEAILGRNHVIRRINQSVPL